jgi:ABC-type branched-subunit amino acid transport system ATPase component
MSDAPGTGQPHSPRDPSTSLRKLREAETAIDDLERDSQALASASRRVLGVTGEAKVPTLRAGIRESGTGWYTLLAICGLVLVDALLRVTYAESVPSVSRATGVRQGQFNTGVLIGGIALALSAFATVWVLERFSRRAQFAVASGLLCGGAVVVIGFAMGIWGFNVALGTVGVGLGVGHAVQRPLLMDAYPPGLRVRVLCVYTGALLIGSVGSVGLYWLVTDVFSLTWRVVFLAIGAIAIAAALIAVRLRDPGVGRWDAEPVRRLVGDPVTADRTAPSGELTEADFALSFAEQLRLTVRPRSVRPMLLAFFVLGAFFGPVQVFIGDFLEARWNMEPLEQWGMCVAFSAFALPALVLFARRGEGLFQANPARFLRAIGLLMGVGSIALGAVTFFHDLPVVIVLFGVTFATYYVVFPAASVVMLSVVAPNLRGHASALAGVFFGLLGAVGGRFAISSLDTRFGLRWGFLSFAGSGLGIAFAIARRSRTTRASATSLERETVEPDVDIDFDRVARDLIAEEELRQMVASGQHFPLLGCRRIDFSYGQVQVLFDVNFAVDDGEMVALLGTNGAGKSTLLRILSGIGIPSNGTVHFRGGDITRVEAEQRVRLGITQVPGGRAVFGGMTVVDNLRASGHGQGMSRGAIEVAIDETFDAFPALALRRNQSASVLSGGEQQMLGIGRAIMSRPRLLLIDELSLGLAPLVVGQLLETVRRINAQGTAVVLVEQSVNIALSLVDHAYFMEKGEIRFDGVASELLERPDLLRSVFLEGADRGV